MSNTPVDEVSDVLVLAAIDRAERHKERKGAPIWEVLGHLDIAWRTKRARQVRALLEALETSGSLERSRRHNVIVWTITSKGRRRLSRARSAGRVPVLPESPQHRVWRESRALAEQRIEGFRLEVCDAIEDAEELLALATRRRDRSDVLLREIRALRKEVQAGFQRVEAAIGDGK